ncbi:G-type lectin S-receptor-like serine/threonine-protein kinase [Rosa sericea]
MKTSIRNHLISQSVLLLLSYTTCTLKAIDILLPGQSLNGDQKITSPGGIFELGFFTPGNSQNYYIGIWYKNLPNQTVVWVANRNQPVSDPISSTFLLLENGNLTLNSPSTVAIWSTNSTSQVRNSTIAMLLDDGNFVIRDASAVQWQSFDHPTNTWLPGARLGYNKLTKQILSLTPWRNPQYPAPGPFSFDLEQTSLQLLWNNSETYWTSGNWTGKTFSHLQDIEEKHVPSIFSFVLNETGSYLSYAVRASAYPDPFIRNHTFIRYMIETTGQMKFFVMENGSLHWNLLWMDPIERCDVYASCGAFSICNPRNLPRCGCLEGFEPKFPKDWELEDHSNGCGRKTSFHCSDEGNSAFLVMENVTYPKSPDSLVVDNIDKCRLACLRNCSCTAFAYDNQCLIWGGDLFNVKQLSSEGMIGKVWYLRVAASEKEIIDSTAGNTKRKATWIVVGVLAGIFTLFCIVLVVVIRRQSIRALKSFEHSLVLFNYRDLRKATENFSEKLGEGAFGSVFKGILPNSTPIAVKQLKSLLQGEKQFQAEVRTLGAIQHINLLRLRGFCADSTRRLLVYDYMPNGSLQSVLVQKHPLILNWKARYHIAIGIARGLAYLHEDCRDCIIHCDIKPENILLDEEYNPKIGDFGLAKLIGRQHSRVLTTVRGTVGYLAPEWYTGEAITPKADVFSYGKLMFEVISGKRNSEGLDDGLENYTPNRVANAVTNGQDVLTLVDYRLGGNADKDELIRACKVACWCIQDEEKDRPTMRQVVQILEGALDVGIPPIPQFLQHLSGSLMEAINYREPTSSSEIIFLS